MHGSYVRDVLPTLVLLGTGIGISFPSLMTLAMSGATPEDAGLASGLVNTTVQIGGALGLAVLATLAASRTSSLIAGGSTRRAALTGGYQLAFAVGAGLVVLALAGQRGAAAPPAFPAPGARVLAAECEAASAWRRRPSPARLPGRYRRDRDQPALPDPTAADLAGCNWLVAWPSSSRWRPSTSRACGRGRRTPRCSPGCRST